MYPSEILDRLPPNDQHAEKAVLGSILIDPRKLDAVASTLDAGDFYSESNTTIYAAILELDAAGKPIDPVLLQQHLFSTARLEKAGGPAAIAEAIESTAVAAHAEYYAGIVRQKARYRRLIQTAIEALRGGFAEESTPEAIADGIEAALLDADRAGDGGPVEASEAAVESLTRIQELSEGTRCAGLPTGIFDFDDRVGGLFAGELAILAARPGIGKTSLACQIAYHAARRGNVVYFVSLEMSAAELVTRILCGQAGVSSKAVRTSRLDRGQVSALSEAAAPFAGMTWRIHDRPAVTAAEVRRWARRIARKRLDLIVVDYLQLLTPADRRIQRHEQVGQLSKSLKELARELEVPVLCLTQLSRAAVQDSEPKLHHLRESGSIEQDADVVMFLYRPTETEIAKAGSADGRWNAALKIAKNRNGELAKLRLLWHPERTLFTAPSTF